MPASVSSSRSNHNPLADRHRRELHEASAIAHDVIAEEGFRTVTSPAELLALGFDDYQCRTPGYLLPLTSVDGSNGHYAFKPDNPRIRDGKAVKYEFQPRTRPILDIPRRCLEQLGDATIPLIFTEGKKKACAAASLGYCAVDLFGVHNWYTNPEHGGFATIEPLEDWQVILPTLDGRIVYLVFDSDAWRNASVGLALRRLANFLAKHGALVYIVRIPDEDDGSKLGLDDLVAGYGADAFRLLLDDAEPWASRGMVAQLQARIRQLEQERSAVFDVLSCDNKSATVRIIGAKAIFAIESGISRGKPSPTRITIDAPMNAETPDDGQRVGLASDCGMGRNTVQRGLDIACGDGSPIVKTTVFDRNEQGEVRAHIELAPRDPDTTVADMLRDFARYEPADLPKHGGNRKRCPHDPDAAVITRTTVICTVCGDVLSETETVSAPEYQVGAPVDEECATPSYVYRQYQAGTPVTSDHGEPKSGCYAPPPETSSDVGAGFQQGELLAACAEASP